VQGPEAKTNFPKARRLGEIEGTTAAPKTPLTPVKKTWVGGEHVIRPTRSEEPKTWSPTGPPSDQFHSLPSVGDFQRLIAPGHHCRKKKKRWWVRKKKKKKKRKKGKKRRRISNGQMGPIFSGRLTPQGGEGKIRRKEIRKKENRKEKKIEIERKM